MAKNRFEYQKPNDEQVQRIALVRACLQHTEIVLRLNVRESRELSLALTKLEEVSMWANKGIVSED